MWRRRGCRWEGIVSHDGRLESCQSLPVKLPPQLDECRYNFDSLLEFEDAFDGGRYGV
jgi:hypothetical protein